jgi:hypothetical protein
MNLCIGITTFKYRYDELHQLIIQIKTIDPEIAVLLTVNGEYKEQFSDEYRKNILKLCCNYNHIYPIFFPTFTGLAKMWNTLIIHSITDNILILNDDVQIKTNNEQLFNIIDNVSTVPSIYLINGGWSHYVANKFTIDELGYFDERLLGIGEEDGDMTHRFIEKYYSKPTRINFPEISNKPDTFIPQKIKCHSGTKYSAFNRDFIVTKYKKSSSGILGMAPIPMECINRCVQQYPYERYKLFHKNEL